MTTTQSSLWLTGPTARRSPSCGRTDFRRRAAGAEQVLMGRGQGPWNCCPYRAAIPVDGNGPDAAGPAIGWALANTIGRTRSCSARQDVSDQAGVAATRGDPGRSQLKATAQAFRQLGYLRSPLHVNLETQRRALDELDRVLQ
jgi:hypothetical protein